MHTTTAAPSYYRIQHGPSGRCIRLHCEPAPAGEAPQIVGKLTTPAQASHFFIREAAQAVADTYFPHWPVEIVQVSA